MWLDVLVRVLWWRGWFGARLLVAGRFLGYSFLDAVVLFVRVVCGAVLVGVVSSSSYMGLIPVVSCRLQCILRGDLLLLFGVSHCVSGCGFPLPWSGAVGCACPRLSWLRALGTAGGVGWFPAYRGGAAGCSPPFSLVGASRRLRWVGVLVVGVLGLLVVCGLVLCGSALARGAGSGWWSRCWESLAWVPVASLRWLACCCRGGSVRLGARGCVLCPGGSLCGGGSWCAVSVCVAMLCG